MPYKYRRGQDHFRGISSLSPPESDHRWDPSKIFKLRSEKLMTPEKETSGDRKNNRKKLDFCIERRTRNKKVRNHLFLKAMEICPTKRLCFSPPLIRDLTVQICLLTLPDPAAPVIWHGRLRLLEFTNVSVPQPLVHKASCLVCAFLSAIFVIKQKSWI